MNASYQLAEVISVSMGVYNHYGIYVGNGMVIDASKRYEKVVYQTLDDFSEGRGVKRHGIWEKSNPRTAVNNAFDLIGREYALFTSNCEQFVREVSGLVKKSPQIQCGILVGTVLVFYILLSRR